MAWTVGFCNKCGVLMHDASYGFNLDEPIVGEYPNAYGYLNPCPVCKVRTEFVAWKDLSDW